MKTHDAFVDRGANSKGSYKFFSGGRQDVYPGHNLAVELLLAHTFEAARVLQVCRPILGNTTHNNQCGRKKPSRHN